VLPGVLAIDFAEDCIVEHQDSDTADAVLIPALDGMGVFYDALLDQSSRCETDLPVSRTTTD